MGRKAGFGPGTVWCVSIVILLLFSGCATNYTGAYRFAGPSEETCDTWDNSQLQHYVPSIDTVDSKSSADRTYAYDASPVIEEADCCWIPELAAPITTADLVAAGRSLMRDKIGEMVAGLALLVPHPVLRVMLIMIGTCAEEQLQEWYDLITTFLLGTPPAEQAVRETHTPPPSSPVPGRGFCETDSAEATNGYGIQPVRTLAVATVR